MATLCDFWHFRDWLFIVRAVNIRLQTFALMVINKIQICNETVKNNNLTLTYFHMDYQMLVQQLIENIYETKLWHTRNHNMACHCNRKRTRKNGNAVAEVSIPLSLNKTSNKTIDDKKKQLKETWTKWLYINLTSIMDAIKEID